MQKKFSIFNNKGLAVIIFVAAVFRFFWLSKVPPALNWDEVSHGFNAYSILKTGKDEWGKFLPMIFRAYGDYKLPVYIYLTSVSEFIFGLTPFAVRLVSVLAGIGTVVVSYFLVLELFAAKKSRNYLATITSLLVAIEPWSLFVSRPAFEANLALFFFVAGLYFFFRFLNSLTANYLLLTTVFFGFTVWTYNSYRIFTPLMLLSLTVIYWQELIKFAKSNKKLTTYYLLLTTFFFLPMFLQLFSSIGQARYSWVQIIDQGTIARIEEIRNSGGSRLLHNKVTYFGLQFFKNYFSHFSPAFLFNRGSSDYQFNVPDRGLLYLVNMPFFYAGVSLVITNVFGKKKKYLKNASKVLLFWLVLSPIPSSLTREAPHVLRDVTFLPIPMILTAYGFSKFTETFAKHGIKKKVLMASYVSILVIFLGAYLKVYFTDYARKYSESWQYGYAQIADYVQDNYSKYDKIVITKKYGEPHEFLLFYLKWNPGKYLTDPDLNRFYQSNWYWVDGFDKFYFVNDWEISEKSEFSISRSQPDQNVFKLESGDTINCHGTAGKCLLITSPDNFPGGWTKLDSINFLNGKTAFEIYEN